LKLKIVASDLTKHKSVYIQLNFKARINFT